MILFKWLERCSRWFVSDSEFSRNLSRRIDSSGNYVVAEIEFELSQHVNSLNNRPFTDEHWTSNERHCQYALRNDNHCKSMIIQQGHVSMNNKQTLVMSLSICFRFWYSIWSWLANRMAIVKQNPGDFALHHKRGKCLLCSLSIANPDWNCELTIFFRKNYT